MEILSDLFHNNLATSGMVAGLRVMASGEISGIHFLEADPHRVVFDGGK